jgi:RHS repeat-associated protein
MLKKLFTSLLLVVSMLWLISPAGAQVFLPVTPLPPAPLWSGNYPGDPETWSSPEEACQAQHDYYNPNATLLMPNYAGGQFAHCNWQLNANSNTILPALASEHCPTGWNLSDPGACLAPNYASESRAQCNCKFAPPGGTPMPAVGDPIALNYSALVENETDYAAAESRFAVERDYYSLGEDYTNTLSPTAMPGFGGRWHGVVPGRLAYAGQVEYFDTDGSFSIFKPDDARDQANWGWHTYGATRLRLSIINVPTGGRDDYFYNQASVLNGPPEVRMDMPRGEYILFRRAGAPSGIRYLVPVEHGYADGYRITYTYPDTGEYPSTVTDSLGHQMTLTWADADRLTYASLSASLPPVKVISGVALPDGTTLQYGYGYGTDARGSKIKDRLESATRLSGTGSILWARTFLYENAAVPYGLTGKVDQNGNRLSTYSYDVSGLVASAELAGGVNKYTVVNLEEQGPANFWRQVTNPLGHRTDYVFYKEHNWTDAQRVLSHVNEYADHGVEASSTSYQYDGYVGDLVTDNFTDEMGRTLHFDNDSQLRPTLMREAVGTPDARVTNFTWHPTFDLPTHEDRPGLSIDYTYSTTGLLLTKTETDTTTQTVPYVTAGQARTWAYTWNGNGRLLSINGPKGLDVNGNDDVTTFTYDSSGNLQTATNAVGHATHFADYDANGRPGKMTDPNGIDTLYVYDTLGRLTSATVKSPVSPSADATTTFEYDVEGRISGITSPATAKVAIDHDLAGQVTVIRMPNGDKVTFTRDGMGNVTDEQTTRGDGVLIREMSRTFDGLGRLLSETLGTGRTSSVAYDKLGNITSVTSARSNATTMAFDGLNRLISSVAPDTGTQVTGYDLFDRPSSFTDPHAVQTTYVRDGFGDVLQEISPDRGTSTYYYDGAGGLTASIDGRGQRVDYVRDALGRIVTKTPAGRPATEVTRYTYDVGISGTGSYGIGRPFSVVEGAAGALVAKTQFIYDHRGNVLTKRRVIGSTIVVLAYTYDLADRIQTITYPSGRIVTYARDAYGRVSTVTTQANASAAAVTLISGVHYKVMGPMYSATLGNTLALTQNSDTGGRPMGSLLLHPFGAAVSWQTYGYDNDDNITSITDNLDPTRSITYAYDPVGRLTQSVAASGSVRRQDMVYDTNGNRVRVEQRVNPTDTTPVSTATYTLNAGTNQLASVADASGTRSIAYDGRGNTIGETRPASGITVAYDGYGRLTSYQTSGSDALVNEYNGLDERVTGGTAADPRHYVYDLDGRLMGEYGASYTDVKAETIWLSPSVSTPVQPDGGDDGLGGYAPLAIVTGGTLYWVHGNQLGVPIMITDSAGNVAAPTGYTLVGFPGQTRTLPDLYYNRYRDYDPTIGRYIQADPIGLGGGSNPYLYADGNPVSVDDPLGLDPSATAVVGVAFEWWAERQVERAATRRIPVVGQWLSVGDAIGAVAAVSVFVYKEHCDEEDRQRCETAKQDARRIYWDLVNKRMPQYISGGTKGPDPEHYKTLLQRQVALRRAINRVRIYCKVLPPEIDEWERVANLHVIPWH